MPAIYITGLESESENCQPDQITGDNKESTVVY